MRGVFRVPYRLLTVYRARRLDALVRRLERERARCDDTEMAVLRLRKKQGLRVPERSDWSAPATRSQRWR
jgi:hypothetical protein